MLLRVVLKFRVDEGVLDLSAEVLARVVRGTAEDLLTIEEI